MDKIDRLLDAIQHPDRYSDRDMEAMLADPEVREVYDVILMTKASLTPISAPDVDAEWEAFERAHRRRGISLPNLFSRNVAASVAVALASLAAVAAVVGLGVNYVIDKKDGDSANEIVTGAGEDTDFDDTIFAVSQPSEPSPGIVIFDNEPFESIAARIARYYGYKVIFTTDTSKSLRLYFRWDQTLPLDEVIESLNNFDQLHLTVMDKSIKID